MTIRASDAKLNNEQFVHDRKDAPLPERCLSAKEVERLAGVDRGDAILCTHGVLWVTQEGDPQDYLIGEGEMFVANRHGVVLVEALTDSACRFSPN